MISKYTRDDYISVFEAAKWLEVSERRIRAMIGKQLLPGCIRGPREWIIPLKSVSGYHKRKVGRQPTTLTCNCRKPTEPNEMKHEQSCSLFIRARNAKYKKRSTEVTK